MSVITSSEKTGTFQQTIGSELPHASQSQGPSSLVQQIHQQSNSSDAHSMRSRMLATVETPFSPETKKTIL